MAATTYLIGNNTNSDPDTWSVVSTLLSSVSSDITVDGALESDYQPFSGYINLGDKVTRGIGLPVASWRFKALRLEQRENLRDFVSSQTTEVYIRTRTNETVDGVRVWKDFLCLAKWVERPEINQDGIDAVMQVIINFEHMVDVTA